MTIPYGFKNLGPFTLIKVRVNRGDGRWWDSYGIGYKTNKSVSAGPDRFTIQIESRMH